MKSIAFLLLVFIGVSTQAQDPCPFKEVKAKIGDFNHGIRIKKYKNYKIKALNDNKEREKIIFSTSAFIQLMTKVNSKVGGIKKYDGLRAYFAVYYGGANQEKGKMTIVFVPTVRQANGTHEDDLTNCMVLEENAPNVTMLSSSEASRWVKLFQNGPDSKYSKFDKDGKNRRGSGYQETKSLWYDIEVLSDAKGGLLFYLECNKLKIKNVVLKFGGFGASLGEPKYSYHLTLIYGLIIDDDGIAKTVNLSFTQRRVGLKKWMEPDNLFHITSGVDGNVDTGVPCPPYPPGADKCPGALLPLQQ